MKKFAYILFFFFTFLLFTFYLKSQTPTEQWTARYQRPTGSSGIANQMALDKVGNCYVLGNIPISGGNGGILLIKYNSSGDTLWTRTYNIGSGNASIPYGLVCDSLGNVYFTGSTGIGSFGPYDIVLIKFNPTGVQQWINTYNSGVSDEPRDITMDKNGNVYIGGLSGNESIIIKYKPNGDTVWVRKYTEPGYRFPSKSIALDVQNNVCLFGGRITISNGIQEYYTLKYDSNGVFQWIQATAFNTISAPAKVKTDLNGNVIVTGKSLSGKIVTIKYNSAGAFQWQAQYTGPVSGTANPQDIKIDKLGNILITGSSWGSGSFDDYVTIKYNVMGDTVWVKRYNGTVNDDDIAYSMDLDDSNNVYISGRSVGNFNTWDYVTIKYNPLGLQQWLLRYPNSSNSGGIAYNVLIDKNRNVYVSGISDSLNITGYVTIKYSQTLGINFISAEAPDSYCLQQNYPNPFNPVTNIKYQIIKDGLIKLIVYDILGNEITSLVNKKQNAGNYEVTFNSKELSSGIYFYRMTANGNIIDTKKFIVLK